MVRFLNSLLAALICMPPLCAIAAPEIARDYAINAAVYQWYGKLDQGQIPPELTTADASISLPEYNGQPSGGAHHLLSVELADIDNHQQRVDVTLEFLPHSLNGETQGHYLEAELYFDSQSLKLSALRPRVHEIDDFNSNYRSASDTNLIRALIFRWTEQLDNPAHIFAVAGHMGVNGFTAAETGPADARAYLDYLSALQYAKSRREIKNLNFNPTEQAGVYRVEFEYQWRAWNALGEEELAQIAVQMTVVIEDGEAHARDYRETYLPPVTDLGAEIRC